MIDIDNVYVLPDGVEFAGGRLRAIAVRHNESQPADLVVSWSDGELCERDFAGLRFCESVGDLVPVFELAQWRNCVVVMGLRRWALFRAEPVQFLGAVDLYREPDDDRGYYREEFLFSGSRLFGVYEGGVICFSAEGDVRWHRRKSWSDELTSFDGQVLCFFGDPGGGFTVDCESGEARLRDDME